MEASNPPKRRRKYDNAEQCSEPVTVTLKKKRKERSTDSVEQVREATKTTPLHQSDRESEIEGNSPWKSLQLSLSLQDKNIDLLKKVNLAFDYVRSSSIEEIDDTTLQVISTSRTIVSLNDWVQSVLISSEKKTKLEEKKPEFGASGSVLDTKCWKILHFCLEKSKNFHLPLICYKDFLRVIHSIVIDALSYLNNTSLCCEGTSDERMQLYDVALDCVSLVFSSHGGVANQNLDLWILLMDKVLELILAVVEKQLEGSKLGYFTVQLSCYLFEPFAKFLRVHPTRKVSFHNFIDKLLVPLLHLLHVLHSSSGGSNIEWMNLSKFIEEVLAQGLFHPTHIDGFLNLQSSNRYRSSDDETVKKEKVVIKSYHRHLFDKVEKMIAEKNGLALIGLAELLHLFVSSITKHKGGSKQSEVTSKNIHVCHSMEAELRKSIFDYFVQISEYLLEYLNKHLQSDGEAVSLFNVSRTVRSIKNLLASFISDKLYLRTEDTEWAARNYLKLIYDTVMSISSKFSNKKASSSGSDEKSQKELYISVRKDLIVTVHHLLDIEYEVAGGDLESLWTMIFSSVACCYSSIDVHGQPLLLSEILRLGCKLIDLYSELRQVDSAISSLCRALRHSSSLVGDSEVDTPFASCSSYSDALNMLLCSSKFRTSLSSAIKAAPGQSSGCIKQLSSDIMESLDWIKCGHSCDSLQFRLRAELLGKVLSEVYIIMLDSITVTSGNSRDVGVPLKNLLEIIRPGLSNLVSQQEICVLVDGITLSESTGCDNVSICWILVVFFRLLLSYRSLFRQTIRLLDPSNAEKMSLVMSDSLTIRPGSDWLEMDGSSREDLFSSIIQPSATVLNVIHSVLDICIQDSAVLCPPFVWVLNAVALQRLVELNLLIQSFEYKLQWKDVDDSSFSKSEKRVTKMRKEAVGLTKFMMGIFAPSFDGGIDNSVVQSLYNDGVLRFSVGSLEEKSLAYALWWINCQHVDIWCSHAKKKDLKKFLTRLIQASLSYINEDNYHSTTDKPMHQEKVTAYQIALEFLSNTISYEQRFVCSYMASSFCKILQMTVSSIFATSEVDLSESPDWIKVTSEIEKLSDVQISGFPWRKPDMVPAETCNEQINVEFAKCQRLLTLLVQMPEEYLSLESSSLYITYILNLERLLVSSLLDWRSEPCSHNPYQIFGLLVTCRKVLPTLALASRKVNVIGSQSPGAPKCSLPLPWLLKSVSAVTVVQNTIPEDNAFEAKVAIFSLLHYTSYACLIVSKDQFDHEMCSVVSAGKLRRRRENLKRVTVEQSAFQLAEALEENVQKSLTTFKDEFLHKGLECLPGYLDLNKLSSTIACFQGLLWGLASTLGDRNAVNRSFRKNLNNNTEMMTRINSSVHTCMNFTSFFLKALFLEDDPTLGNASNEGQPSGKMVSSDMNAFLSEVQHRKLCLKKTVLMQVFRGENAEACFFLGQLFITCSAVVRLNMQIDLTSISWSLFPIMVDIAQFLLLEFSRTAEMPNQFVFFWLDGVVKFLEELGSCFSQFDPLLSRDFYAKLVGLHLRVVGKCISLQTKEAKLDNHVKSCVSLETSRLDEIKERLRVSFRKYIEKSSELNLRSAIVAVERALVGEKEGLMTNYEIVCGSSNGGEVSSFVAGGIACLDSILEFLSGSKRLDIIKEHIQNLVACLFNVILHLQGPSTFYEYVDSTEAYERPDSGSVILLCVDILTKISRKPHFFKKGACHMVQCLRVPGALFQYLLQLQISVVPVKISSDIRTSKCAFDRKFSVDLYAISCRMLCTYMKNHDSETENSIALLEDSTSVLLHCLETVNVDQVSGKESFAWEVQDAVKCASSLRRVYEELRQQKDVFGKHSFKFLSCYIWVYCGFGPAGNGITREVDEALKPGVYALLDTCLNHDFQYLHTAFGEGPCTSTLASLKSDYENNFKYGGKV